MYMFEPREPMNAGGEPVVCAFPDYLDATAETKFLHARGLITRARCITDNYRVGRALLLSHAAIGILPEYVCGSLLSDRSLRATLLPQRLEMWLLVQNHLKRNAAARVVIDWMREVFSQRAAAR
jgi:DNA-binding transcriptional LysR family regulator